MGQRAGEYPRRSAPSCCRLRPPGDAPGIDLLSTRRPEGDYSSLSPPRFASASGFSILDFRLLKPRLLGPPASAASASGSLTGRLRAPRPRPRRLTVTSGFGDASASALLRPGFVTGLTMLSNDLGAGPPLSARPPAGRSLLHLGRLTGLGGVGGGFHLLHPPTLTLGNLTAGPSPPRRRWPSR